MARVVVQASLAVSIICGLKFIRFLLLSCSYTCKIACKKYFAKCNNAEIPRWASKEVSMHTNKEINTKPIYLFLLINDYYDVLRFMVRRAESVAVTLIVFY